MAMQVWTRVVWDKKDADAQLAEWRRLFALPDWALEVLLAALVGPALNLKGQYQYRAMTWRTYILSTVRAEERAEIAALRLRVARYLRRQMRRALAGKYGEQNAHLLALFPRELEALEVMTPAAVTRAINAYKGSQGKGSQKHA